MRRDTVVHFAHVDRDAVLRQIAPDRYGVIRQGETGFFERTPDLARVDIERASDFDIARTVTAEIVVHQSEALVVGGRALVMLETLEQGGCTIPHSDNCHPNLRHFPLLVRRRRSGCGVTGTNAVPQQMAKTRRT
jgi:hypothetical protein